MNMDSQNNPLYVDRWIGVLVALLFVCIGIVMVTWLDRRRGVSVVILGLLPLAAVAKTSKGAGRWSLACVVAIVISLI